MKPSLAWFLFYVRDSTNLLTLAASIQRAEKYHSRISAVNDAPPFRSRRASFALLIAAGRERHMRRMAARARDVDHRTPEFVLTVDSE